VFPLESDKSKAKLIADRQSSKCLCEEDFSFMRLWKTKAGASRPRSVPSLHFNKCIIWMFKPTMCLGERFPWFPLVVVTRRAFQRLKQSHATSRATRLNLGISASISLGVADVMQLLKMFFFYYCCQTATRDRRDFLCARRPRVS